MVESYRELIVWQRAIQLSVALYRFTHEFPRDEAYGLIRQLRRAGVSLASNIAEGYGRGSSGEYRPSLGVAGGANYEVQTQLVISKEPGFGNAERLEEVEGMSNEVGKMLNSMLGKL
ncbi:MAG TPA: four helix bundle protein [Acidisarcina sp.]